MLSSSLPLPSSVHAPGYLVQPYRFSQWQYFLEYFIISLQIVFQLSPKFHPESQTMEKSRFTLQPLPYSCSVFPCAFLQVHSPCKLPPSSAAFSLCLFSLVKVIIKPGRDLLMSSSSTSCSNKGRLQS